MAFRASASSAAIPPGGASLTRATSLQLQDVPGAVHDLESACFVWGTAASEPATYGDLANAHHVLVSDADLVFSAIAGVYRRATIPGATITGTAGLHLWVGYVASTGSPISGTTLDSVYDVGAIIA